MLTNPKEVPREKWNTLKKNYDNLKDQMTELVKSNKIDAFSVGLGASNMTTDAEMGKKMTGLTRTLTNLVKIRHLHNQGKLNSFEAK